MITNRELDLIATDPVDLARRLLTTVAEPTGVDVERGDDGRDADS